MKRLWSLDVGGCGNVTAAAIQALRKALPNLVSLREPHQGMIGNRPGRVVPR